MNTRPLIDSMLRQLAVLIVELATTGGVRVPLDGITGRLFLHLAEELERRGVTRKVSADMLGIELRAYLRKVNQPT